MEKDRDLSCRYNEAYAELRAAQAQELEVKQRVYAAHLALCRLLLLGVTGDPLWDDPAATNAGETTRETAGTVRTYRVCGPNGRLKADITHLVLDDIEKDIPIGKLRILRVKDGDALDGLNVIKDTLYIDESKSGAYSLRNVVRVVRFGPYRMRVPEVSGSRANRHWRFEAVMEMRSPAADPA